MDRILRREQRTFRCSYRASRARIHTGVAGSYIGASPRQGTACDGRQSGRSSSRALGTNCRPVRLGTTNPAAARIPSPIAPQAPCRGLGVLRHRTKTKPATRHSRRRSGPLHAPALIFSSHTILRPDGGLAHRGRAGVRAYISGLSATDRPSRSSVPASCSSRAASRLQSRHDST